jgi:hypothetical protein
MLKEVQMPLPRYFADENPEYTVENIGEFLVDVITSGLYIEPHLVLREYLQNSHDAIIGWQGWPTDHGIDVKIDKPNIHIADNGPGMDRENLLDSMRNVGISTKVISAGSGFMGIGRLAGLAIAERVEIHSSAYGVPERNRVVFLADEMSKAIWKRKFEGKPQSIVKTLQENTILNAEPLLEIPEKHYTVVHLMGIREKLWPVIESEEFLDLLGLVAPVRQNPSFEHSEDIEAILEEISPEAYCPIPVTLNGKPLYRPFVPEVGKPKTIDVADSFGNQIAYGWACLNSVSEQIVNERLRSIAMMNKGIIVGDRSLLYNLGAYGSTGENIMFRWYTGELYLVDHRIMLSASRTALRMNTPTQEFIELARVELKKLLNPARKLSRRVNAEKRVPEQIAEVRAVHEQFEAGELSQEILPAATRKVVTALEQFDKRKAHLQDVKLREELEEIRQIGESLLAEFTKESQVPSQEPAIIEAAEDGDQLLDAQVERTFAGSDSVTAAEEEQRRIASLPEELGMDEKAAEIYWIILEAIAETCGGYDCDTFVRYFVAIEKALREHFTD